MDTKYAIKRMAFCIDTLTAELEAYSERAYGKERTLMNVENPQDCLNALQYALELAAHTHTEDPKLCEVYDSIHDDLLHIARTIECALTSMNLTC